MTDLAAFADENFDPVAWINAQSKDKLGSDGLDRYLSELEMRLQLAGEEIDATLTETCSAALRRIPYAQQEVSRLRGDIVALQGTAAVLAATARSDAAANAAATAPLAALALIKGRMEGATATLKEALELSSAFRRVEEVFAAGDLPQVARMLASMARSLSLVGDVPEFREGRAQLAALQERLSRQVEGRLGAALAAEEGQQVSALAAIVIEAGRYSTLERLYCSDRTARALHLWEAATAGPAQPAAAAAGVAGTPAAAAADGSGSGWLLLWCNQLLELLQHEQAWLAGVVPERQQQLLAALVMSVLHKVSKPLKARLTAAATSTSAISMLLGDMLVLLRGLLDLLAGALQGGAGTGEAGAPGSSSSSSSKLVMAELLRAVLEPLEEQVSRYGRLEEARLSKELTACLPADPAQADLESALAQLSQGLSAAFSALRGGVESCLALSGGTELRGLLGLVDKSAQQYLVRLQATSGILLSRLAAPEPGSSSPAPEKVALMLQLVVLGRGVSRHLSSLEALLRSTITTAIPRLASAAAAGPKPGAPVEVLPLRLLAFPEKLAPLQQLLQRCSDTRFVALPGATSACDSLSVATANAVYEALLQPVNAALTGLPGAADWGAAAPGAASGQFALGVSMPAFNAYPLGCVTAVGEYLMTLPQQLEALIQEEGAGDGAGLGPGGDGDDELATEWLDKVVHGAALTYVDRALALPALGPGGGAQVAADAEYIANVLSALAVAVPAQLLTLQLFAALPAEQWTEVASAAVADGSADARVLRLVAGLRGVQWQQPTGAGKAAAGGQDAASAVAADGGMESAEGVAVELPAAAAAPVQ